MEQTKNRAIPPAATRLSALLVAVLLFLRLPFLVAAGFGAIDQDIGLVVFLCGTYLCTGLFFCLNRGELGRYYITPATLALFLLSPLAALLADGEDITGWLRLVMAACFAGWLLWKKGVCTGRLPARKHLANLAITLPLCVLLPVLCWTILGKPAVEGPAQTLTMGMVLGALGFQFSFAAVSEEPLFRGILHGLLKKGGGGRCTFAFWWRRFSGWATCII